MERKYSFEAGLNVFTSYKTIIPVEDFSILKKIDPHRYHIYGILSYNQFFIRKKDIQKRNDGIKVTLLLLLRIKKLIMSYHFLNL